MFLILFHSGIFKAGIGSIFSKEQNIFQLKTSFASISNMASSGPAENVDLHDFCEIFGNMFFPVFNTVMLCVDYFCNGMPYDHCDCRQMLCLQHCEIQQLSTIIMVIMHTIAKIINR